MTHQQFASINQDPNSSLLLLNTSMQSIPEFRAWVIEDPARHLRNGNDRCGGALS